MESIDGVKTEPEFEIKEEPPDERDTLPVQYCMQCQSTISQENMINVILNEERLHNWAGLKLEYNKSNWICKSHFNSTDFTEKGILNVGAVPYRVEIPADNDELENQETLPEECALPPPSFEVCVTVSTSTIDNANEKSSNKPVMKNPTNPTKKCAEVSIIPRSLRFSGQKCVYCSAIKHKSYMTLIRGQSMKLARWIELHSIQVEHIDVLPICKSHFTSENFTKTGKLKYNACFKLQKECPQQNNIVSVWNYVMCVYCKLKQHPLRLIKVPRDEEHILRWKLPLGVRISYREIAEHPWVCKSHFSSADVGRSGILNPFAQPLDIPPERCFVKCDYCHSTKNVLFLVNIKLDKTRMLQWSSALGTSFNKEDDTIWICKTHFCTWDFTHTGKLRHDAVPMDGRQVADVRTCVYCKIQKPSVEFSKIVTDRNRFEVWKKTMGFNLDYDEVVENSWMCKSHFEFSINRVSETEKQDPFPMERVEEDEDSHLCVWCFSKRNKYELAPVSSNLKNLPFWERENGSIVELEDIARNPWVCESHFTTECITNLGTLRIGSIPRESVHYRSLFLPEIEKTKCVLCGMMKNRSGLSRILMKKETFEWWAKSIRVNIHYDEIIKNPWCCKTHFSSFNLLRTKYSQTGVKQDAELMNDPVIMCAYCKLYEKRSIMDLVNDMNRSFSKKWMKNSYVSEKNEEIQFVCKSHFETEDLPELDNSAVPDLKQEESEIIDQIDDQQVEDLLDAAIQIQPEEEEKEQVRLVQYIPELQDHTYAKFDIDI